MKKRMCIYICFYLFSCMSYAMEEKEKSPLLDMQNCEFETIHTLLNSNRSSNELLLWLKSHRESFKSSRYRANIVHVLIDKIDEYDTAEILNEKLIALAKAGADVNEVKDVSAGPENKWYTPMDRINDLLKTHEQKKCPNCSTCYKLCNIRLELLKYGGQPYGDLILLHDESQESMCALL